MLIAPGTTQKIYGKPDAKIAFVNFEMKIS
jgi:hypothetical protein